MFTARYIIAFVEDVACGKVGASITLITSVELSEVTPGSTKFSPVSILFWGNPINVTVGMGTGMVVGVENVVVTSTSNVEKNVLYR